MNLLRPRTAVLGGAGIGLIAAAVIYGTLSSASVAASTAASVKPAKVVVAAVPAAAKPVAAHCGKGQKLEHGVCIIHVNRVVHVVKVVVRPAPVASFAQARTPARYWAAGPTGGYRASSYAPRPAPVRPATVARESGGDAAEAGGAGD